MTTFQRLFGTGPRGFAISLLLLIGAWQLDERLALPVITSTDTLRYGVSAALIAIALFVIVWGVTSLPPAERGKRLVTSGAFRFFRHPLYAALVSFLSFGLAVLSNGWIYLAWAAIVHLLWHWNVRGEEALMREEFGGEYDDYCKTTGRFLPVRWNRR